MGREYGGKVSDMFRNGFIHDFAHKNYFLDPKTQFWVLKINFGSPKTNFGIPKSPYLGPENAILGPRTPYLGPRICSKAIFCRCGMPQSLFCSEKITFLDFEDMSNLKKLHFCLYLFDFGS